MIYLFSNQLELIIYCGIVCFLMMLFILWGWVMQDFKLLTRQLLETYLGSDTLSDVAIQDFFRFQCEYYWHGKTRIL